MRKILKQPPLKIGGSMTLTGDLDKALVELKKERDQSLKRLIAAFKRSTSPIRAR